MILNKGTSERPQLVEIVKAFKEWILPIYTQKNWMRF